ncbi:endonuclease/exonuclease/phosphatase family protein [Cryptosporangium phraense]|uniref:endonuclease/exonuclease/phosphatase family protein n=1 Tax=Cryptosporangium phraense TaxID=2593070 RepID=UPI0014786767|nr:endonuclease/exonuclease/phosphatase family protein [Cryptosporangium phraense]
MLRVATLNVCGLPPLLSRLPPLDRRAAAFGRVVEDSDVDVFNVQEVWGRRALGALRRALPSFPHVAFVPTSGGGPSGGLVTFSRTPTGRPAFHSFRGTAPRTSTALFRARRALNARRQGILSVPLDGAHVVNTHLTSNRDGDWTTESRYYQFHCDQLDRLHSVIQGASVVTGDFNIAADSPLYPRLVGDWHDPFAESDPITYHPEFLPAGARGHRIDYVLTRGDATAAEVLFAERLPSVGWASDHLGLAATVLPG